MPSWLRGACQVHQHDVVTAGLEFHGLASGQIESALDGLCASHDVAVHSSIVDLGDTGCRAAHSNQFGVGLGSENFMKAPVALAGDGGARQTSP